MSVTFNLAFIGAGQVNFGGGEGPWDHCRRIEVINSANRNGEKVQVKWNVVAIADPWETRCKEVLETKRKNTKDPEMWANTQIFKNYLEMLEKLDKIDIAFIGVPPEAHGSTQPNIDIEVQCARRGIHLFVEKPISCYPLSEVEKLASELDQLVKEKNLVVSVGYMFRYSLAVRKMKEIIAKYGTPRIFNARYNCAYAAINKVEWWDNDKCGGPIVEQGTHFCDLARFIVGEVDLDSVYAIAIKSTGKLGKLNGQAENVVNFEEGIPEERRIVRSTVANWRFENGALGTLTHGVLLHGRAYETELEVWGDGYRMALLEPYTKCRVSVRFPESEEVKVYEFYDEDVYLEEDQVFVDAIVSGNTKEVASTYADAMQTYRLTWKIRTSSEQNK